MTAANTWTFTMRMAALRFIRLLSGDAISGVQRHAVGDKILERNRRLDWHGVPVAVAREEFAVKRLLQGSLCTLH